MGLLVRPVFSGSALAKEMFGGEAWYKSSLKAVATWAKKPPVPVLRML